MADFEIKVQVGEGGVATLDWNGMIDAESLQRAVSTVADDALLGHGLRRLELALPAGDRAARRAVLRAGFRLEGVRREALVLAGRHATSTSACSPGWPPTRCTGRTASPG